MKQLVRWVGVGVLLLALASLGVAQSKMVGEWTGALTIVKKPGAKESAEEAKMRQTMQGLFSSFKIDLTLKADRTFKLKIKAGEKNELIEGVWTLKGDKLTMTSKMENGKPPEKEEPQVFTVAKDGSFSRLVDDTNFPPKIEFKRKKA